MRFFEVVKQAGNGSILQQRAAAQSTAERRGRHPADQLPRLVGCGTETSSFVVDGASRLHAGSLRAKLNPERSPCARCSAGCVLDQLHFLVGRRRGDTRVHCAASTRGWWRWGHDHEPSVSRLCWRCTTYTLKASRGGPGGWAPRRLLRIHDLAHRRRRRRTLRSAPPVLLDSSLQDQPAAPESPEFEFDLKAHPSRGVSLVDWRARRGVHAPKRSLLVEWLALGDVARSAYVTRARLRRGLPRGGLKRSRYTRVGSSSC